MSHILQVRRKPSPPTQLGGGGKLDLTLSMVWVAWWGSKISIPYRKLDLVWDRHLSTYAGGGAYLPLFIYVPIHLHIYPFTYLGRDGHLFMGAWQPIQEEMVTYLFIQEEMTIFLPMLEEAPTYLYLSIYLFIYVSILLPRRKWPPMYERVASYLGGDGYLPIYLGGDGDLYTYVGKGAYLFLFIYISIQLHIYPCIYRGRDGHLSMGGWQPI